MEYVVATCRNVPKDLEDFLNAVEDLFHSQRIKRLSGDQCGIVSIVPSLTGHNVQVVFRCQFDYASKEDLIALSHDHSRLRL